MMLTLATALALKEAGLTWQPRLHDFFAIPQTELEDRLFVLTDVMVDREVVQGWPAFSFNGAVEWALDYVFQAEAVWVPRDDQLLAELVARVARCSLVMDGDGAGYRCFYEQAALSPDGEPTHQMFAATTGAEAYALALLSLLAQEGNTAVFP
jgi:hypothetical protein